MIRANVVVIGLVVIGLLASCAPEHNETFAKPCTSDKDCAGGLSCLVFDGEHRCIQPGTENGEGEGEGEGSAQ